VEYDIVLCFTTFRRCGVYLPIVKELGRKYKIGIYSYPINEIDKGKVLKNNELFLDLLHKHGASCVVSHKNNCKILLIPQWHYEDNIECLFSEVVSDQFYWLVSLAMGNYNYENLYSHVPDKILLVDKRFYEYRLSKRPKEKKINISSEKIIEVGTPYQKYPCFKEPTIDYIIANPTPFSFQDSKDKLTYLSNIELLLNKIKHDEIVAYKPHNASGIDSLLHPRVYKLIRQFPSPIRQLFYFVSKMMSKLNTIGHTRELLLQILIIQQYEKMMKRVVTLSSLTKYHNFNLELFLPNVKKGLITGRSNSIWHGLYAQIPIYNCVSDKVTEVSKVKMHSFNMTYFNLQCCNGLLDFDKCKFEIISDETRGADLVRILTSELNNDNILHDL
jgi:hypothetical protein